jgi:hypothetical protein
MIFIEFYTDGSKLEAMPARSTLSEIFIITLDENCEDIRRDTTHLSNGGCKITARRTRWGRVILVGRFLDLGAVHNF